MGPSRCDCPVYCWNILTIESIMCWIIKNAYLKCCSRCEVRSHIQFYWEPYVKFICTQLVNMNGSSLSSFWCVHLLCRTLSSYNLTGQIPTSFANLTALTSLWVPHPLYCMSLSIFNQKHFPCERRGVSVFGSLVIYFVFFFASTAKRS